MSSTVFRKMRLNLATDSYLNSFRAIWVHTSLRVFDSVAQALAISRMPVLEICAPTPCRKPQISHSVVIGDVPGCVVHAERSQETNAAKDSVRAFRMQMANGQVI